MSPVTRHHTVFFYQVIALLSLLVLVAGVGGLSLVWLRQQIADSRQQTQAYQRTRNELVQRVEYLDVKIAEVHRPAYLERRVREEGLALQRPRSGQIVSAGRLPGVNAPLPSEAPKVDPSRARDPYTNTFDLAVMEPLRRLGE